MVETGSGQGRILSPKSDETIMREAELLALRNIGDTLTAIHSEMGTHREAMATMREDMAVIKERQQQHNEFRNSMKEMSMEFRESIKELGNTFQRGLDAIDKRVDALEARNLKQDGVTTFATLLKDFGPWAVSVFLGLYVILRI